MPRPASVPCARLVHLVLCLSLLAQPMLLAPAGTSAGRGAVKVTSRVVGKAVARQEAEAADLPDLNEARERPHHEPRAVPPVPSTRRRCPPRNRRCNDSVNDPPDPTGAPAPTPAEHGNPHSLASVRTQLVVAVLSAAMGGGLPVVDIPLLDYFVGEGGSSVSDTGASPALYAPAAAPLAQTQANAAVFVA